MINNKYQSNRNGNNNRRNKYRPKPPIYMKQQQEQNLVIQNNVVVPNKYYSDFECDLYLYCENLTREMISKRKNEYEERKTNTKKLQVDETNPTLEVDSESPTVYQNTIAKPNIPPPPPSSFLYTDYINTLPRQYAGSRGELIQSENKTNDWKDEDGKEKAKEIDNKQNHHHHHHHHRSNSDSSESCSSISDVEDNSKDKDETSSISSSSSANRSEEEEEESESEKNNKNNTNINSQKKNQSSSSLLTPQDTALSYRKNQELYNKQVKNQRCPIQFVLIRYRGYSSFLHAIKSCVWGTNKGIATSLQELYSRGSHVLLCFSETKSSSIQGIASMTSPIYICKTQKHYNFCHIFRIHWDMIHTVKFSEIPFFDVKEIRLEIDFESGRDILNIMSGGIQAKQEKISLTNNFKLQNPWKYKYLRQESLNREILKQKIRYDMLQYDTAKIYGLSGYLLPNIKFIMNPFLPHDNPQKTTQRY